MGITRYEDVMDGAAKEAKMVTKKNATSIPNLTILLLLGYHFGMDVGCGGELCDLRCSRKLEKLKLPIHLQRSG